MWTPLIVASYDAGPPCTAYVEPLGVGEELPDTALFLKPGQHVLAPLQATYDAAWQMFPKQLKRLLEPPT